MKVTYKRLIDPQYIIGPINTTSGKDIHEEKLPSIGLWNKMIRTCGGVPHSPIRSIVYRFYVEDIPTWVATHYVRHHIGVQFYVQSQREDRTGIPRDQRTQNDPVNMIFDVNVNGLINIAKARLCSKASPETNKVMIEIKEALLDGDKYDKALSIFLVPTCGWCRACFEPNPCKKQYRGN